MSDWTKWGCGNFPSDGDQLVEIRYLAEDGVYLLKVKDVRWSAVAEWRVLGPDRKSATSALQTQEGGDHYKDRAIQPIQYIHANNLNFCEGSIVKYITRWRDKGKKADLLKIKHYVDLLIELEKL